MEEGELFAEGKELPRADKVIDHHLLFHYHCLAFRF